MDAAETLLLFVVVFKRAPGAPTADDVRDKRADAASSSLFGNYCCATPSGSGNVAIDPCWLSGIHYDTRSGVVWAVESILA